MEPAEKEARERLTDLVDQVKNVWETHIITGDREAMVNVGLCALGILEVLRAIDPAVSDDAWEAVIGTRPAGTIGTGDARTGTEAD